jgi:hypothetical protein
LGTKKLTGALMAPMLADFCCHGHHTGRCHARQHRLLPRRTNQTPQINCPIAAAAAKPRRARDRE